MNSGQNCAGHVRSRAVNLQSINSINALQSASVGATSLRQLHVTAGYSQFESLSLRHVFNNLRGVTVKLR
jgi:hypothetical protein